MSEDNKEMALKIIHGAKATTMAIQYQKSDARVGVIVKAYCKRFFYDHEWQKMLKKKWNNKKICAEVKKMIDARDSLKV